MVHAKSRCAIAVFCALMVLPLSACGHAAGGPAAGTSLPDEPGNEPVLNGGQDTGTPAAEDPAPAVSDTDKILEKYGHLDPNHEVPTDLLEQAVLYYDSHLAQIANQDYLSVIDFAARSTQARFFIINMQTGKVWAIHVAHGKGSDPDHDGYATSFSNASGSNKSALGVYRTAETYSGNHGLSLRLDGLSNTNSNARSRAIVLHGASYVEESASIQGRSLGCPAVAMENRDRVVSLLKGGSIIFAGLSKN